MIRSSSHVKQVLSQHTMMFPHSADGKDALQMWKQLQQSILDKQFGQLTSNGLPAWELVNGLTLTIKTKGHVTKLGPKIEYTLWNDLSKIK